MTEPQPDPPQTVAQHFNGHCCADDPECEHSYFDDRDLAAHMASPWKPEREAVES